jgi:hypothetical protein
MPLIVDGLGYKQLSKHFNLAEMTRTDTGLLNKPKSEAEYEQLRRTAEALEQVRSLLKRPIVVTSGYRSPEVNKAVRGIPTSAHCLGYAVDFVSPEFGSPFDVATEIAASKINFDQLILEYGWVHISFDPRMRRLCLTKRSATSPYQTGIKE